MPDPGALGANVKRLREAKGLSQNALAKVSGVSQAFISDVERGYRQAAMSNVLVALAKALGVTVDELLREAPQEAPGGPLAHDAAGWGIGGEATGGARRS